jgi:hypothetical protein
MSRGRKYVVALLLQMWAVSGADLFRQIERDRNRFVMLRARREQIPDAAMAASDASASDAASATILRRDSLQLERTRAKDLAQKKKAHVQIAL